ncbi:MAG TPA: hypothetical protein VFI29_17600 [Hanamia sp.]|nr:hypothetical protein [Hanamia sp.]
MKQKKLQVILGINIMNSLMHNYYFMNDFLIKQPIQDIVIGFCFERSSTKDERYVSWFTMPLYYPHKVIGLTFGNRIQLKDRGQIWDFSDTQIENTAKDLLPQLLLYEETINELEIPLNFYKAYHKKKQTNLRIYEAVTYTACWLELSTMHNEIESCIKFIENENDTSVPWIKKILDNMKLLQAQKSKKEILSLLKGWKADNLKELKLE